MKVLNSRKDSVHGLRLNTLIILNFESFKYTCIFEIVDSRHGQYL